MPKYLVKVAYSAEGTRGLLRDGGRRRRQAVSSMVEGLGGDIEAFYYAMGEEDLYIILNLPSCADMAAVSMAVTASGGARFNTVTLLTPDEVDDAAAKAVNYHPPGS
ncbi:MAG: GYD domain-containing protein [Actinobacteria bacterium]|nr:GYD domain-containing protein [Actinomycetota bacterium]